MSNINSANSGSRWHKSSRNKALRTLSLRVTGPGFSKIGRWGIFILGLIKIVVNVGQLQEG